MTGPFQYPLEYVGPTASDDSDVLSVANASAVMATANPSATSVNNYIDSLITNNDPGDPANDVLSAASMYATAGYLQSYAEGYNSTATRTGSVNGPPQSFEEPIQTGPTGPLAQMLELQIPKSAVTSSITAPSTKPLVSGTIPYYNVAGLSTNGMLLNASTILPPGGQGYVQGPWGMTGTLAPAYGTMTAPQPIAYWNIGAGNMTNFWPLAFMNVVVNCTMAHPAITVTMYNSTTPPTAGTGKTGSTVGIGQGRRFFNDEYGISVVPFGPGTVETWQTLQSLPNIMVVAWLYNTINAAGSEITSCSVKSGSLYLFQNGT